jgi:CRP/FNR family cyclic AMP-dependent transcriptional regulator
MPKRKDTDPIDAAPLSDSLRALARRGVLRPLRKGAQIISEGDVGDTLFIVLSGELRAYSVGVDGRELTYGNYGAGEYLGEMSLDGGPRSANVEATQSTVVAMVTRRSLETHLHEEPAFAFDLLAKVIRRARHASLGLKQIALNNVYGRLKDLLESLAVAQPGGARLIDPAPTHLEMSQRLGCSREMVSKVLKELEKGGYVVVERQRLVLLKKMAAKW